MKKERLKKILFLLNLSFVFIFFTITSSYAKEYDPYEEYLNQINQKYNLNLGYNKVNPEDISLEDYKKMVETLGKEQRETLDYIEFRKKSQDNFLTSTLNSSNINLTSASSYDVSDTKYYSSWAMISATYTCYPGTPNRVGNPRDVVGSETPQYFNNTGRWYNQEDWEYKLLDGGRTLAITTTGYTCTYGGIARIDNVIIYGEFYFK